MMGIAKGKRRRSMGWAFCKSEISEKPISAKEPTGYMKVGVCLIVKLINTFEPAVSSAFKELHNKVLKRVL